MTKVQRRTRAQWQEIIEAQARSGQTAKAYCREQAIGLASFYQWRKRLTGGAAPAQKPAAQEFIELEQARAAVSGLAEPPSFEAVLDLGAGISMTLRRN